MSRAFFIKKILLYLVTNRILVRLAYINQNQPSSTYESAGVYKRNFSF